MTWTLDAYETIFAACVVLIIGNMLIKYVQWLANYNIPSPVVGGFLTAFILTIVYLSFDIKLIFDGDLSSMLMLVFFSSIGLAANFKKIKAGGIPLLTLWLLVSVFIVLQNTFGIGLALLVNLDPAYGLITSSVTMSGGHGNGAAWAPILQDKFLIKNAMEVAMTCATFGLVAGGLVGGPIARHLMKKSGLELSPTKNNQKINVDLLDKPNIITSYSILETIFMLSICLIFGKVIYHYTATSWFSMPEFVWCIFVGIIIRNFLDYIFNYKLIDESIEVIGNVSLSLFLAIVLSALKMWELTGLALPILFILSAQTVLLIIFAIFVTYKVMGSDYDAIVTTAGHAGFALGATPTAIANIQQITNHYGASHKALLIVSMTGAFLVDISNNIIIKIFVEFLSFIK